MSDRDHLLKALSVVHGVYPYPLFRWECRCGAVGEPTAVLAAIGSHERHREAHA